MAVISEQKGIFTKQYVRPFMWINLRRQFPEQTIQHRKWIVLPHANGFRVQQQLYQEIHLETEAEPISDMT
jgi:hypothetical protein